MRVIFLGTWFKGSGPLYVVAKRNFTNPLKMGGLPLHPQM